MVEQYNEYGSIPAQVQAVVANKVSLLDQYVLMQTGAQAYTALIRNGATGEVQELVFYRDVNYGPYQMVTMDGEWAFDLSNEFYCYSNVGYGAALDLPVVEGVTAYASCILACALMLAIVFKGVLFPCLRKKRRGF